jgi:hypothetical protein
VPTYPPARRVLIGVAVPATLVALAGAITFAGPAIAASAPANSGATLPFPTTICSSGTATQGSSGSPAPTKGAAPSGTGAASSAGSGAPSTGSATSPAASGSPSAGGTGGASSQPTGQPAPVSSSGAAKAPVSPSNSASPSKSPSPSPSATNGGILGWLGGIVGGLLSVRLPHAVDAPVLGAGYAGSVHSDKVGTASTATPTTTNCLSSSTAKQDAADAKADDSGTSTIAADQPWHLSTPSMTMWNLTYNGVVTVTTAAGPVQALDFTASKATILSMVTYSQQGGGKLQYNNSGSGQTVTLTDVTLLTTSLSADLLGLLPATFTPTAPPPLIVGLPTPIPLLFTNVQADNAFMNAGSLDIPGFDGYGTS